MIRIAAIALASLLLAAPAMAQAKEVKGDWIKLGDVAPVTGKAADILLGAAPPAGQTLSLAPGKHKVTFVIGDDRFTYPVVIKAGVTETMSKDLQ